jgi:hypothetical protein
MSDESLNVVWSWLRVFLAALITATLVDIADGGLDGINWEAILIAGIVAVGPVVVNWLNSRDPRYGRGYMKHPVDIAAR